MTNLPINVFKPHIPEAAIEAVSKVLRSGWTGNGPITTQFEKNLEVYLGGGHATTIHSATAALQIALQLMDVGPSDECITVGNTFVSTGHAVLYQGAVPVFVDIEKETGCIDSSKIEEKITPKTKVIICVHLSGLVCDLKEIRKIASKYNLWILHDAAHAFGSSYFGEKIGNVANYPNEIATFSGQSVKNLSVGDFGVITTPTLELAQRAKRLRWMGITTSTHDRAADGRYKYRYECDELGWKANTTDIMSAIAVEQLKILDQGNQRREQIAMFYKQELEGFSGIRFAEIKPGVQSAFHFYPMFVERRDDLLAHMQAHQIFCGVHYVNNANYKVYKPYFCELPNSNWWSEHEITLPIHLHLTDEDVRYVIDAIKKGW